MAEIVNLRLARKARQRADKQDQAAANRAKFGQTKGDKAVQQIDMARATRNLDGAKLETD